MLRRLFARPRPMTTPDEVRAAVLDALAGDGAVPPLASPGDDPLRLTGGEGLDVNLHNLAAHVLADGVRRRTQNEMIEGYVRSLRMAQDGPPPPDPDTFWPAVRHADYVADSGVVGRVSRPLAGDLVVVLVQNLPESIVSLDEDRLAAVGVSPVAAMDRAEDNLRDALSRTAVEEVSPGLFLAALEDDPTLSTSLLALPDALHRLAERLGLRSPLIGAPTRDAVWMADADDADAVATMMDCVAAQRQAGHAQSDCIFALTDAGLVVHASMADGAA